MSPLLISVIAFVAVTCLVAAVAFILRDMGSTKAEDRLLVMAGLKTPELDSRKAIKEAIMRESLQGISGILSRLLSRLGNLTLLFEQADSPIKADLFFIISGVLGLLAVGGA